MAGPEVRRPLRVEVPGSGRSAMPCTDPAAMAAAQASATAAATGGGGRRVEGGGGGGGPGAAAMRGRGRREDWAEGQPLLPLEGAGRGRRTGRRAGAAAMGGRGRRNGNGEEGGATREGGLWADARGRRKKIPERERGRGE